MNENDRLQLIDVARIRAILEMDKDALWQTFLENAEELASRENKNSSVMYAYRYGMEHFEKIFHRFYDEDPDHVRQGLIDDLCFTGPTIKVGFWALNDYLDDPLSANVPTCHEILPQWDEDSEAWVFYREFRVLEREHIDIMVDSLSRHRDRMEADEYVSQLLPLQTLASTLRSDPTLNAAYIYDTNYY